MRKILVVIGLSTAVLIWGSTPFNLSSVAAQTAAPQSGTPQTATSPSDPGITNDGVIGEVVAVDGNSKQLFVKTDAGSVVIVTVFDNTSFLKNPPNAKDTKEAKPITLAEVAAGDRAFALGRPSDDRKTLMSRRVIINSKADLFAKDEAERAEWRRRGIVGVVSALNPQTKEVTLQTRGAAGQQPVKIVAGGEAVKFRRYAPDSVKFAEAKPSTFEELKIGDQLRAKGEKSADGAAFTAEEVVSGTFRTTVGSVKAIDAQKNEIAITQMQGGAPLTIVVSKDSVLKQVPAEFAARMGGGPGGPGGGGPGAGGANAAAPSGGQGQPAPPGQGARPAGGGTSGGPAGGETAGGPRRMGFDIQQMLETLPAVTVAELKPGQMIVVSSTVGADPTRVTAIQLLSGVEPLVAAMTRRSGQGGGGSMPGGMGGLGGANFGFGIGQP